jgi:hypothetical protein
MAALVPPDGSFHVDILTKLGTTFAFADLETERVPFGEITVSVVTPRTLYRMERDTIRLRDRADAELLKRRFRLEEPLMPVRKFRSVEEMSSPLWRSPGDPDLVRAMAKLWDIGRRADRRSYPPGVHKHASIEDMQHVQEEWAERSRPG